MQSQYTYYQELLAICQLGELYPRQAADKLGVLAVKLEAAIEENDIDKPEGGKVFLQAIDNIRNKHKSESEEVSKALFKLLRDYLIDKDIQPALDSLEVRKLIEETFGK
jgi:hypothetical protein